MQQPSSPFSECRSSRSFENEDEFENQEQEDPTIVRLDCTLEELYCGSTMQIVFSRRCVCDGCQGSGYTFNTLCNAPFCPRCAGTGKEVVQSAEDDDDPLSSVRNNTCGVQIRCTLCDGKGMLLKLADVCPTCAGGGFCSKYVTDEVSIPRGTKHGTHVLVNHGGGDSGLSTSPGNVFAEVHQMDHSFFCRVGNDLLIRKKLTLKEAVCGTGFEVSTLDDRVLQLCIAKGEVVTPGEMRRIRGEGMPTERSNSEFGDLILEFEVEFPRQIPPSVAAALEKVWIEDGISVDDDDQNPFPTRQAAGTKYPPNPKREPGVEEIAKGLHPYSSATESENTSPNQMASQLKS
jgi:DnaJ family protein A protein 2